MTAPRFNSKRDRFSTRLDTREREKVTHKLEHSLPRPRTTTTNRPLASSAISSTITGLEFQTVKSPRFSNGRLVESTRTSVESNFSRCINSPRTGTEVIFVSRRKTSTTINQRNERIDTRRNERKERERAFQRHFTQVSYLEHYRFNVRTFDSNVPRSTTRCDNARKSCVMLRHAMHGCKYHSRA